MVVRFGSKIVSFIMWNVVSLLLWIGESDSSDILVGGELTGVCWYVALLCVYWW